MSVKAELLAVEALRAHLLLKLPAKVTSINAERAAVLKAPRAGPYTVVDDIAIGTTAGSETTVSLTTGSRTATQVAADITTAAVAGITASVDSLDRLTLTATAAPAEGAPSVISLGAAADAGANRAFGWDDGGEKVLRSALVAPMNRGVCDGEPEGVINLGDGFWVLLGKRRVIPDANVHKDLHTVVISGKLWCAEPSGSPAAAKELIGQALRAVREVVYEDRTLGNLVVMARMPDTSTEALTFRFAGGSSPLMSEQLISFSILLHERV